MIRKIQTGAEAASAEGLRSYRAPWKGQLVLACAKCQKKLKRHGDAAGVSKLKKVLKTYARQDDTGPRVRVLQVPCLNLCPKNGVAVCTQAQLGRAECAIVSTADDARALYEQIRREATTSARPALLVEGESPGQIR